MTSTFTYFWFALIGIYALVLLLTALQLKFLQNRFLLLMPAVFVITSLIFLALSIFQSSFNNFLYGQLGSMFFGAALFSILLVMIASDIFDKNKK
ncbi:hypothetical protein [Brochothrix thermosphacta]|uniref:hypothetical protein n=1 Tax=Brochothrix thermosphacta TaxID=2756 RepID=UPI00128DA574|nr:hypothetical protein [Brochothrix thermosphacta]